MSEEGRGSLMHIQCTSISERSSRDWNDVSEVFRGERAIMPLLSAFVCVDLLERGARNHDSPRREGIVRDPVRSLRSP